MCVSDSVLTVWRHRDISSNPLADAYIVNACDSEAISDTGGKIAHGVWRCIGGDGVVYIQPINLCAVILYL